MKKHQRTNSTLVALTQLDLFRSCTDNQLAALLPFADVITVAEGTVIDRSGSFAFQFVGIIDGYVEACDDDGGSTLLGPGDQFGAAEVLSDAIHRATFTTITRASLVVIFGPVFRATARTLPAVAARAITLTPESGEHRAELSLVG